MLVKRDEHISNSILRLVLKDFLNVLFIFVKLALLALPDRRLPFSGFRCPGFNVAAATRRLQWRRCARQAASRMLFIISSAAAAAAGYRFLSFICMCVDVSPAGFPSTPEKKKEAFLDRRNVHTSVGSANQI